MRLSPVTESRPHRSALLICVVAAVLLVSACSAKDKDAAKSSGTGATQTAVTETPQTSASEPDAAITTTTTTTNTTTGTAGASTTISPVAASETTAPDIMRGPPIMSTVPSSTETTVEITT